MVYVLDALDAYNKRLVKKIEVKGFEVKNFRGTDKYLYMEGILLDSRKPPRARLRVGSRPRGTASSGEFHLFGEGDSLYFASHEMEQYRDMAVSSIDPIAGTVAFTSGEVICKGDVVGDVSEQGYAPRADTRNHPLPLGKGGAELQAGRQDALPVLHRRGSQVSPIR